MINVDLSKFSNKWYKPGNKGKILVWYFINLFVFKTSFPFPSSFKCKVLSLFGAKIGPNIVIKPNVSIKYPWFLEVGNNSWIGENVWIDNLAQIEIGKNVCLSQGAMLLTGSHNYKKKSFDLLVGKITLEDGVWIGAKSIVCPNVVCGSYSVLAAGSIATKNLSEYGIYQGNPAVFKRKRTIE